MMRLAILTARHVHEVRAEAQFEAKQRTALRRRAMRVGDPPLEPWVSDQTLIARIDYGRWLGDCACGNGVAIEPIWRVGRCFSCGAVYAGARVQIPDDETRADIEHVLSARSRAHQHWLPGETLLAVAIDNAQHGVRF